MVDEIVWGIAPLKGLSVADHRFDTLSKAVASRLSRRAVLRASGLGLAGLSAATAGPARGQDATPAPAGQDSSFLFVQTATSGTFAANPGAGTPAVGGRPTPGGGAQYLLTLEGHSGNTVYFSDRPERIVGDVPTEQFPGGLGFEPGNPPNAAVVTRSEDGTEDVLVVELVEPAHEPGSGTVTYGVNVLGEYAGEGLVHLAAQQQDAELPASFGEASLFIDDCPDSAICFTALLPSSPVGLIPGGPYGNCFNYLVLSCLPCGGISRSDLIQKCNDAYPAECGLSCMVWEPQDVACC